MRALLLIAMLLVSTAQALAQTIDPGVFRTLNQAQQAQDKGDHARAQQLLDGVEVRPGSFDEALLWRAQAYLGWARGDYARAAQWLEKAVASGLLERSMQQAEQRNLAKLSLNAGRYQRVVELMADQPDQDEEVLQLLVQAYQQLGQPAKALPLAERYVRLEPSAADVWLYFLVSVNLDLKRYADAQRWQQRLLERQPDDTQRWLQLAGVQQAAGQPAKAFATLRTAYARELKFSQAELDNLTLLAGAAGQPWQGARLLTELLESDRLPLTPARQERLALLWWQARDRQQASQVMQALAERSNSGKHWLYVAQLALEQAHWQKGLDALGRARRQGADAKQVRAWQQWAEHEQQFERERKMVSAR